MEKEKKKRKLRMPILRFENLILLGTMIIVVIAFSAVFLLGINKPEGQDNSVRVATESVYTFNYNEETSKAYLKIGEGKKTDISKYVTGYSDGVLHISPEGLCDLFSLTKEDATEEDKESFNKAAETEDVLIDTNGEYLKLKGSENTFIFLENSGLYLVNGRAAIMNRSVIRKNGTLSIPLNYLVFDLGYQSLGVGMEGNSVIFSIDK